MLDLQRRCLPAATTLISFGDMNNQKAFPTAPGFNHYCIRSGEELSRLFSPKGLFSMLCPLAVNLTLSVRPRFNVGCRISFVSGFIGWKARPRQAAHPAHKPRDRQRGAA